VVYPAHGVGQILAIEDQEIAGAKLELFVINFMKDKMTLAGADREGRQCRHAQAVGAGAGQARAGNPERPRPRQAHDVVAPGPGIWKPRFQFGMISSPSPKWCAISIAPKSQPEQSTANAKLYEGGARFVVAGNRGGAERDRNRAVKEVEAQLAKSPRRGAKTGAEAEADARCEGEVDPDADGDDAAVRMKPRKAA